MGTATVFEWASRLRGQNVRPVYENNLAKQIILKKIGTHRALDFKNVGEVPDVEWMVVMQIAHFKGRVGMGSKEIPQFSEGEREEMIRKFLAEEGVSSEPVRQLYDVNVYVGIPNTAYEFQTMLC